MIVPLGHDETEGQGSTDNGEKMTHTVTYAFGFHGVKSKLSNSWTEYFFTCRMFHIVSQVHRLGSGRLPIGSFQSLL